MKPASWSALQLRAAIALRHQNPWLLVSGLLWLAGAVLWLWVLPISANQLQRLQDEAVQARTLARVQTGPVPVVRRDNENLAALLDSLGDARHVEQQVSSLLAIARGVEVPLAQGQYRLVCEDQSLICAYRLQFPMKGTFPRIRAFVEQALYDMPFLSLDEFSVKRESLADDEVEARIVMTVMLRNKQVQLALPVAGDAP